MLCEDALGSDRLYVHHDGLALCYVGRLTIYKIQEMFQYVHQDFAPHGLVFRFRPRPPCADVLIISHNNGGSRDLGRGEDVVISVLNVHDDSIADRRGARSPHRRFNVGEGDGAEVGQPGVGVLESHVLKNPLGSGAAQRVGRGDGLGELLAVGLVLQDHRCLGSAGCRELDVYDLEGGFVSASRSRVSVMHKHVSEENEQEKGGSHRQRRFLPGRQPACRRDT